MICDFLKKSEYSLKENNEKSKVNELLQNLIDNWENNETCQQLQDIKNEVIKHPRSAFILKSYKQIISKKNINNQNIDEQSLNQKHFSSGETLSNISNSFQYKIAENIEKKNEDNNFLEAHDFLIKIGLIIEEKKGFYQVSNRLYKQVFSDKWIEHTFKSERPYNDKFMAWKRAYKQDESSIEHLISGEELNNALEWIADLQIPPEEEIYLIRSRVFN